jgi:hypothetical protein
MKIKANLPLTCFTLSIMLFLFAACERPSFLTVSKTTPIYVESPEPLSSATPLPSSTETATQTLTYTPSPTGTNTATATLTPTVTPTKFTGFENARVEKAYADDNGTVLYFNVPGVATSYYGTIDGYELICTPDPDQENLLTCRSEENLYGTNLYPFEFFADEAHTFLVYKGSFLTNLDKFFSKPLLAGLIWPRADFTTADVAWGDTPADCSARGINLSCEIEYRRYEDNSCLVGMSCFDSCGYYYSVDTIKSRSGAYTFSGACW